MPSVVFNMLYLNLLLDLKNNLTSEINQNSTQLSDVWSSTNINLNTSQNDLQENNTQQVCYVIFKKEVCFLLGSPWGENQHRPIFKAPSHPKYIKTTFYVHRRSSSRPAIIYSEDFKNLEKLDLNANLKIRIIAHGYLSSSQTVWVKSLVDELLRAEDGIIILTDWSNGAKPPYVQASANIRIVGVQVAYLILQMMQTYKNITIENFHLIGHSLGAHLLAQSGSYLKNMYNLVVPRITALDPAGPLFIDSDPLTRLDPTDAKFVDVIHTDNEYLLGFPISVGMASTVGHLDFYPNGGMAQPKCSYGSFRCHHLRAPQLFIESIRQSCSFIAVPCDTYKMFIKGECWSCENRSQNKCSTMGLKASPLPDQSNGIKLFLKTYGNSPYCGTHYRITIESSDHRSDRVGEFAIIGIELNDGSKEATGDILLSERSIFYDIGSTHRRVIIANDLDHLDSVGVTFHYPGSIFNPLSWRIRTPKLYLDSVIVEKLYPPQRWKFCFEVESLSAYITYYLNSTQLC